MAKLRVELVSVEREVWSGEASTVIVRTTEGELGVLPGHAPLLAQLAEGGLVRVLDDGGETRIAAHGGFVSVTDRGVAILAEVAELAEDIDEGRAREALKRARSAGPDDPSARAAERRAESRLRAVGQPA